MSEYRNLTPGGDDKRILPGQLGCAHRALVRLAIGGQRVKTQITQLLGIQLDLARGGPESRSLVLFERQGDRDAPDLLELLKAHAGWLQQVVEVRLLVGEH